MKTKVLMLAILLLGGWVFTSCQKDNTLMEDGCAMIQADVKTNYTADKELIYRLSNYPDPFVNYTTIEFNLPEEAYVELSACHSTLFKEVVLVRETKRAGIHTVGFYAADMPAGSYCIKLEVNREVVATKTASRVDNGSELIFPDVD